MVGDVLGKINANVPKATKEISAPSPSASLVVELTGPARNPINANAGKAGTDDTVTKGMEPASCMP